MSWGRHALIYLTVSMFSCHVCSTDHGVQLHSPCAR